MSENLVNLQNAERRVRGASGDYEEFINVFIGALSNKVDGSSWLEAIAVALKVVGEKERT